MKNLQIIGYLEKDAEILKTSDKNIHTIMFSVAHTEKFINKKGEEEERTDWFTCFKRYKNKPDKVLEILKKGLKVYVLGKPNFGLNTSKNGGVYVSVSINVMDIEFMSNYKPKSND